MPKDPAYVLKPSYIAQKIAKNILKVDPYLLQMEAFKREELRLQAQDDKLMNEWKALQGQKARLDCLRKAYTAKYN